jgi:hypothetical protein
LPQKLKKINEELKVSVVLLSCKLYEKKFPYAQERSQWGGKRSGLESW